MNPQEKLKALREKHDWREDFAHELESWETVLKQAIATQKFGENPIIKGFREALAKEIAEINVVILNDRELTEVQRLRLMDKRGMYERFVNLFYAEDRKIESIEKRIDFEMKGAE